MREPRGEAGRKALMTHNFLVAGMRNHLGLLSATGAMTGGVTGSKGKMVAGVCNRLGLPDRWKTTNPAGKPYFDLLFNAYDVTDVYVRTGKL